MRLSAPMYCILFALVLQSKLCDGRGNAARVYGVSSQGDILLQVRSWTNRSKATSEVLSLSENSVTDDNPTHEEAASSHPSPSGVEGTIISRAVGSDLMGDSLSASHGGTGELVHEAGEAHGYVAILYFFVTIAFGCVFAFVQERYVQAVPYTCILFAAGFVLGYLHYEHSGIFPASYHSSVDLWAHITPHMLFYVFLPALIFGDAMRLNTQLLRKVIWQVLLLAGPGVLIGTGLTAVFAVYVFPYPWDWPIALVFGAILAATDPVAVLALFKELGVAPRLTMCVAGESLLNDGTAMVVFQLMLKIAVGAKTDAFGVTLFFLNMTVMSCIVGFAIGLLGVVCIGACAERNYHHDAMIQVVITICTAYLSYFISEHEFSASGILATVAAGVIVAKYAWPRFTNRELVDHVWEAIEFIGNTVIFFLAGLIFANKVRSRQDDISLSDVGWLLALYVAMTVVRAIMLLVLWLPLNSLGRPLCKEEGITMVWSGLRGAIGLTMAIIVDRDERIEEVMGSRVMFHVGGLAAMTTLINASTCAPLLRWLGLTKTPRLRERMQHRFEEHTSEQMRTDLKDKLVTDDPRFQGASEPMVLAMLPMLDRKKNTSRACEDPEDEIARILREVFIRSVQACYWKAIEQGVIYRSGIAALVLLHSTSEALENTEASLCDWEIVSTSLQTRLYLPIFKDSGIPPLLSASLVFQYAHAATRKAIPALFSSGDAKDDKVEKLILAESSRQCQLAEDQLKEFHTDELEIARSQMLARQLLYVQTNRVGHMRESGVLTEAEASSMSHEVDHEVRRIVEADKKDWINAKEKASKSTSAQGGPKKK